MMTSSPSFPKGERLVVPKKKKSCRWAYAIAASSSSAGGKALIAFSFLN
jgi:hypothetical protein